MKKEEIRREMLKKRRSLSAEFVEKAGAAAVPLLRCFPLYRDAETVMLYMDYQNEFPTAAILTDLLTQGKIPVLPRTDSRFQITAYRLPLPVPEKPAKKEGAGAPSSLLPPMPRISFDSLLASSCLLASPMGILEPNPEVCQEADPARVDLVLVPGVAFDRRGGRIGFGKACYDRFLPQLRREVPRVGLAYEFQVFPTLPTEPGDIPMDFLLTERSLSPSGPLDGTIYSTY